jgi:hypothetical protein
MLLTSWFIMPHLLQLVMPCLVLSRGRVGTVAVQHQAASWPPPCWFALSCCSHCQHLLAHQQQQPNMACKMAHQQWLLGQM